MKIGVVYPQTELRGDPEAVRRIAIAVESLGYDYLLSFDHVIGATHDREPKLTGPYTEQHPFHDPLMMFAHVAALTRRIELVTGILILPQRPTVLVARQAADLDLLSGERLRLGVGIGWNYVEYQALGQNFKTRGRRLEEQIKLLRMLWTQSLVDFQSEFEHVERVALNPRPRRSIPIWCGGFSEPAYRRAAQIGDGFIFTGTPDRATEGWKRVEHYLHQAGRPIAQFGKEMIVGRLDPTLSALVERVRWCRDWGCTHVAIDTMGKGLQSIEAHIRLLTQVREHLGVF